MTTTTVTWAPTPRDPGRPQMDHTAAVDARLSALIASLAAKPAKCVVQCRAFKIKLLCVELLGSKPPAFVGRMPDHPNELRMALLCRAAEAKGLTIGGLRLTYYLADALEEACAKK